MFIKNLIECLANSQEVLIFKNGKKVYNGNIYSIKQNFLNDRIFLLYTKAEDDYLYIIIY